MNQKIHIFRAGWNAIRKVLLTCTLYAFLFLAGLTILQFYFTPEDLTWHWPALSGILGLMWGLHIHNDTYTGLTSIGATIGFITGLMTGYSVDSEDLLYPITLGLLFAFISYFTVCFGDH